MARCAIGTSDAIHNTDAITPVPWKRVHCTMVLIGTFELLDVECSAQGCCVWMTGRAARAARYLEISQPARPRRTDRYESVDLYLQPMDLSARRCFDRLAEREFPGTHMP